MPDPVQFNFDSVIDAAQAAAAEKEAQVNDVLWGHLAKRAAQEALSR